jgi:UDP-N-acetylmuramate--alanine ligase
VVSSAVREENNEVREARRLKIPSSPGPRCGRADANAYGIAVAGSHGKTTTTSMVAAVLDRPDSTDDHRRGRLNTIGAHAKLGEGDFFVAEADESDRSFLMLSPFIAVLTNIDANTSTNTSGIDDIKRDFVTFANKVPFYCPVILCWTTPTFSRSFPSWSGGSSPTAFPPRRISTPSHAVRRLYERLDAVFKDKEIGPLHLNVPGPHMVLNALAAVAVGYDLDIPPSVILEALAEYAGTGRRFEMKADRGGIMVIEDYGHHPTEIRATLNGAKLGWPRRRLIAVFQPHPFTRLAP